MGPRDRRHREKEELRNKILDAARELFATEGYERVTMRGIAERIEYSPTAIYAYFPDKLGVMQAVCDRDFAELARQFRRLAEVADPLQRLRLAGRAYAAFALAHPQHYQLMFMTAVPGAKRAENSAIERGNPEVDAYAFLKWTLGQAIQSGRLREGLDDVEQLSQMAWAAVHGVVSLYIVKCDQDWVEWRPALESAAGLTDAMVRGILRDPADAESLPALPAELPPELLAPEPAGEDERADDDGDDEAAG